MSLTSYRAAPPRVNSVRTETRLCTGEFLVNRSGFRSSVLKTWQRPTFPHLKMQYHWRERSSRPSSGWDRVWPLCYSHQVVKTDETKSTSIFVQTPFGVIVFNCLRSVVARVYPYARNDQKPIELLVPVSFMRYRTSTPGLSTWWSSTALEGVLVSRWVSRLDAFSGYPVHT